MMILVFLVPGFLSMAFLAMLVPARERDDLQKIASALIFSLVIYFIHSRVFERSQIGVIEKAFGEAKFYEVVISLLSIAVVSGAALLLSMVCGFVAEARLPYEDLW